MSSTVLPWFQDPEIFQPNKLNTTQWVEACGAMGATESILVAKHHDGFMLYPTPYTNHSVVSSSWRGGQGDVVADFAASCAKVGVRASFYLSPWDRNQYNMTWKPAYNEFYESTLTALATNYGPWHQLWWDGANGGGTPPSVYDWDRWIQIVRELQPTAVGGGCGGGGPNGYDCGPDTAWNGNEDGRGLEPSWSAHPGSREFDNGTVFMPYFCDVSIRGGWFYHESQSRLCTDKDGCDGVKSLAKLVDIYHSTVGQSCVLQLNVPPTPDGLLHEIDVKQMRQLGAYIRALHASDAVTSCASAAGSHSVQCELDAARATGSDVLLLQEDLTEGQKVASFRVEVSATSAPWTVLAEGTTIGQKRLLRVPPLAEGVSTVRLTITSTIGGASPAILKVGVLSAPPV